MQPPLQDRLDSNADKTCQAFLSFSYRLQMIGVGDDELRKTQAVFQDVGEGEKGEAGGLTLL